MLAMKVDDVFLEIIDRYEQPLSFYQAPKPHCVVIFNIQYMKLS